MLLRGQIAAVAKHRPLSSPSPGAKAEAPKEDAPIERVLSKSEELDVAGGTGVAVGGDTEVGYLFPTETLEMVAEVSDGEIIDCTAKAPK